MRSLPHVDVPHVIADPPLYIGDPPQRIRARFCPDCVAGQYAVRGRILDTMSHYCPDDGTPVLVHWFPR
jgi:hypothetical protein